MINQQQFLQMIMNNSKAMQNPAMRNAIGMVQSGDYKGVEQLVRNICKERGIDADERFNQIKNTFMK